MYVLYLSMYQLCGPHIALMRLVKLRQYKEGLLKELQDYVTCRILTDWMHYNWNVLKCEDSALTYLFTYNIRFGLNQVDWTLMFKFNHVSFTRGHCYKLYAKTSRVNVRHNFFCNRVVSVWNCLPARAEHFCSYSSFKSFLLHVDIATLSSKLSYVA